MCYYITATIPNHVNLIKTHEVLQNYNLGFEEIINPNILSQTSNRYFYFRPTTNNCDCETALGKRNRAKNTSHQSTISKLEKKGWSKTKIDRWLSKKVRSEFNQKTNTSKESNLSETEFWHQLILKFFSINLCNEFGLLIHWYEGSLKEEFKLKNILKINSNHLSNSFFEEMENEILYLFQK
ncbi:hypothetical protein [Leptospira noguchii]|uniref:Uncharacterized protein n=1 Tax=Leptospira noguchii TaxID=28182 RepID=M6VNG4_9LEPT|nr:hypothetical protein [Leptospira noguchii]EMO54589.1 hypothetical protein LEP1GSC172_4213 [Leptospira noguchii]